MVHALEEKSVRNDLRPTADEVALMREKAQMVRLETIRLVQLPMDMLDGYCRLGNPLGDHPDMTKVPRIDFSSGLTGHALSNGLGIAMGGRMRGRDFTVFAVMGEVLAEHSSPARLVRHGIKDDFSPISPPTHLYDHYRLDEPGMESVIRDLLT